MRQSLPILGIVIFASALAAACSGGATQPAADASIAGNWRLAATIADTFSTARTSCTLGGNVSLTQTGPTFTGQLTGSTRSCTGPGATAGAFDGPITQGQIVADTLSFRTSAIQCVYGGDANATSSPTSISGFITCALPRGTGFAPFSGNFQLTH